MAKRRRRIDPKKQLAGKLSAIARRARAEGKDVARAKAAARGYWSHEYERQAQERSERAARSAETRRQREGARVKTQGLPPRAFRPVRTGAKQLSIWEAPRIAGEIDPDAAFGVYRDLNRRRGEKVAPRRALARLNEWAGQTVRVVVDLQTERYTPDSRRETIHTGTVTQTLTLGVDPRETLYGKRGVLGQLLRRYAERHSPREKVKGASTILVSGIRIESVDGSEVVDDL